MLRTLARTVLAIALLSAATLRRSPAHGAGSTLDAAMADLGHRAGVAVIVHGDLPPAVVADVRSMTVAEALQHLLHSVDVVGVYAAPSGAGGANALRLIEL